MSNYPHSGFSRYQYLILKEEVNMDPELEEQMKALEAKMAELK